jgi:hypothetical protein
MTIQKTVYLLLPLLFSLMNGAAHSQVRLISAEEAAFPELPSGGTRRGSMLRGPTINIVSPLADQTVGPISKLHINFLPRDKTAIDLKAVRVSYLKLPIVDLTDRVLPFMSEKGIEIPQAQIPPGKHTIKIEAKDLEGRTTVKYHEITIAAVSK